MTRMSGTVESGGDGGPSEPGGASAPGGPTGASGASTHVAMQDGRTFGRPIEILLVEDSPSDVRLTQEALKRAKVRNNLSVVRDGAEALAFLRRQGNHAGSPRPDLVLLDLNLPKKGGRDVLAEIKVDEALRRIPVVILTTSKAEEDILRSYDLHANCYITKPVDLHQFISVVQSIEGFWLTVVQLPESQGA